MSSFRYVPPGEESATLVQGSGYKSGALIAAFQILDTKRQGFFSKDILLHILTRKGDRELDADFVEGVLDQVSTGGRVYYKDICELFRETAVKADNKMKEIRESKMKQEIEPIQEEVTDVPVEISTPTPPLDSKPDARPDNSFGDSDDSYPSLEHTPVPTPADRPGSASTGHIEAPSRSITPQESINDPISSLLNTPSAENLEEASSKLQEYARTTDLNEEATIEEFPELLKQTKSSQD